MKKQIYSLVNYNESVACMDAEADHRGQALERIPLGNIYGGIRNGKSEIRGRAGRQEARQEEGCRSRG